MARPRKIQKLRNDIELRNKLTQSTYWLTGRLAHEFNDSGFGSDQDFADECGESVFTVRNARRVYRTYVIDNDLAELIDLPGLTSSDFHFVRTHPQREKLLRWASKTGASIRELTERARLTRKRKR
jgi:hypothetical protein